MNYDPKKALIDLPTRKHWNALKTRVRVWDNGGHTVDRYTVVIRRTERGRNVYDIYTMSENCNTPNGINQYSHTQNKPYERDPHETRIRAQNTPLNVNIGIITRL